MLKGENCPHYFASNSSFFCIEYLSSSNFSLRYDCQIEAFERKEKLEHGDINVESNE